jgi:hypothetical protein
MGAAGSRVKSFRAKAALSAFATCRKKSCQEKILSGRFALASGMTAQAIEIRRFFHRLAFGAAVPAGRNCARTNWVRALPAFCSRHIVHFICRAHVFSWPRISGA